MSDALQHLEERLTRELSQAEYDGHLHTRRTAKQLGSCPPTSALLAIAAHAEVTDADLRRLMSEKGQGVGRALSAVVGNAFSNLRHFAFDRMIAPERSYRATLLGLRHGLDATHLLLAVATRRSTATLATYCADLLATRTPLLADAVDALSWFSEHPERA